MRAATEVEIRRPDNFGVGLRRWRPFDTSLAGLVPARPWIPLALGLLVAISSGCTIPRWPVEGRLVSAYGLRWSGVSPDFHPGVDILVPSGSTVRVMAPGRVRFAGVMDGYGNVVWVDHGTSLMTVYAHLSRIDVEPGDSLEHRQALGLSGQSGNATAPHLHFEVWRWGRERDPVPLLGGPP